MVNYFEQLNSKLNWCIIYIWVKTYTKLWSTFLTNIKRIYLGQQYQIISNYKFWS